MIRTSITLSLLTALLLLGCKEDSTAPRPNVLLITLDTTRADYLSCYGYKRKTTPHMDQLAREGVRFERAMSSSAVTPVSHATILTGLYQYEHGVRVIGGASGSSLEKETQSLATVLKKRGYRLGAVHSSFPVSAFFGFDQDYDFFESFDSTLVLKKLPRWDENGRTLLDTNGKPVMREFMALEADRPPRRSDETVDLACQFLDETSGPFFLWTHFWDPHDIGEIPPDEFLDKKYCTPAKVNGYLRTDDFYAEEVRYLDSQLGRFLEELKKRGLYENTLILLAADHGEGLQDGKQRHGWHAHRELYAEQLHVPLVIKLPKSLDNENSPATVSHLVGTVDILPTVCDLLDLPLARPVNGKSLRSSLEGGELEPRRLYADQINGYDLNAAMTDKRPQSRFIFSVTNDEWKLIYRPTEASSKELYRVSSDPREEQNVAKNNPAIVDELMIELSEHAGWVTEPFPEKGTGAPPLNLDGLGYVGSTSYEGAWEWVCPIEHESRGKTPGTCPECSNLLVPVAIATAEPAQSAPQSKGDANKSSGNESGK